MYNDHKKINSIDYVFDFVFPVVVLLLEHTLNTHILLRRERSFSLGMDFKPSWPEEAQV